jgi:outer membrane protein
MMPIQLAAYQSTFSTLTRAAVAAAAAVSLAVPAWAEDGPAKPGRRIMVGAGGQTVPRYPGADDSRIGFLPSFDTWKDGEPIPVESPDEGIGFAVIGSRDGIAAGPAMVIAATRSTDDLPGLAKVGFGMELGGFVELWPAKALRLRTELRQAIGAHKGLVGDVAADLVWRESTTGESAVATLGPRLRWGSGRHNRAYFGVPSPSPVTAFGPYEPGSGLYAVGANAGLRLPLGRTFGLYAYAGYDRLIDKAADSPIVRAGSRDQFSAGAALTYRFTL